jgi:hypothetical protein
VDIDNYNERLEQYSLDKEKTSSTSDAKAKFGFLKATPSEYTDDNPRTELIKKRKREIDEKDKRSPKKGMYI